MFEESQPNKCIRRHNRSYIRRDSRLTTGQQNAIDSGWSQFGLNLDVQPLEIASVFNNTSPVILDIGFGNGEALAEMASNYQHYNFIGVDTHKPGVGHLLIEIAKLGLGNVRIYNADVISVLSECIQNNSVNGVHIFFPDPWHKRRHHKRRLITPAFIELITAKLCRGGYLIIATDWFDYADSIEKILHSKQCLLLELNHTAEAAINIPERPITKFESRGLRLGHVIREFKCIKQ